MQAPKYKTLIRKNLLTREGYTPHCGEASCHSMPRSEWTGEQFRCPACGWESKFTPGFIQRYKSKWRK